MRIIGGQCGLMAASLPGNAALMASSSGNGLMAHHRRGQCPDGASSARHAALMAASVTVGNASDGVSSGQRGPDGASLSGHALMAWIIVRQWVLMAHHWRGQRGPILAHHRRGQRGPDGVSLAGKSALRRCTAR
ncbi:hypothetical protein AVEN_103710-1 [Araneus ventricosus]|uniref:Uncharacterized protein n=1 Tax=Araneus ventricosus TaxID=182803 RepID=A0A4Y2V518_ARAVE|nr:hypothetical protein AVEN_103710-1 [Araneus ventricosus]